VVEITSSGSIGDVLFCRGCAYVCVKWRCVSVCCVDVCCGSRGDVIMFVYVGDVLMFVVVLEGM
jgi:hypothetical protein